MSNNLFKQNNPPLSTSSQKQLTTVKDSFDEQTSEKEMQETPLQTFIRLKGIYVAMVATFTGLFIGVPIIFWFSSNILINVGTIFIILFLCGSLGLIQWKYVRYQIDMHYHQFAMYAFTGFGIWMFNFLLLLNLNISISSHSETYSMESISINENNMNVRIGNSETSPLAKNLSSFLGSNFTKIPEASEITITYKKGLLGFDVIGKCEFH